MFSTLFSRLSALVVCAGLLMFPASLLHAGEETASIETSHGLMTLKFFPEQAPNTVANFKRLAKSGWYEGKTFYRIVKGHVIQAGSADDNDQPLVKAEFNSRPHIKGAVGLARSEDPDSGSTEIYICHEARPHLDGKYTVFGQLTEGIDVLDKIANIEVEEQWVGDDKDIAFHGPVEKVIIKRVTLKSSDS
jgi:cyclophilin family peptidyl-prolyl cis-trans isomerase